MRQFTLAGLIVMTVVAVVAARETETPSADRAAADVEKKSQALLAEWKARFDAERFHYAVSGPFVIAGDGSDDDIARYRDGTVLAAARALWATYFTTRPTEP